MSKPTKLCQHTSSLLITLACSWGHKWKGATPSIPTKRQLQPQKDSSLFVLPQQEGKQPHRRVRQWLKGEGVWCKLGLDIDHKEFHCIIRSKALLQLPPTPHPGLHHLLARCAALMLSQPRSRPSEGHPGVWTLLLHIPLEQRREH